MRLAPGLFHLLEGVFMPWFRARTATRSPGSLPLTLPTVRSLIGDVVRPAHFFVGTGLELSWDAPVVETVPWELFQGRLLDPAFTRRRRSFEAWNVHVVEGDTRSAEPLLSVRLDAAAGEIHVTRAIYCYAWEGYDSGGNVYLSRETCKWVRELVGTIALAEFADAEELRDELACRLFRAVVGTSRLPLTSLEAPLPAFSLGQLAYCYRPAAAPEAGPLRSPNDLAALHRETELAPLEKAKLLETLLRVTPPEGLGALADSFPGVGDAPTALLQTLFNEVSLSPYTDLADRMVALLQALEERGRVTAAEHVDFLSRLLRQLVRHLSAYDLVTFHQRGANYPDALLLDTLLKAYLGLAEQRPELFAGHAEEDERPRRLRRRALRQAWLVRSWYEGLAVPDAPTSQGEALRVLPPPHPRIPEEQILQPAQRQRHLFADDPLARRAGPVAGFLQQALNDLERPEELHELGTAFFLDRPFGSGKAPTEPDATLLFSYEAFSPTLAGRRLEYLSETLHLLPAEALARHRQRLRSETTIPGLGVDALALAARPGVVSLADVRQAAPDFRLLRTTARSIRDFLELYDFDSLRNRCGLDWLSADRRLLIVRSTSSRGVTVHDGELRRCLELTYDPSAGYTSRAGIEFPASGLQIVGLGDGGKVGDGPLMVPLRRSSAGE
jgi:hypothetical protein